VKKILFFMNCPMCERGQFGVGLSKLNSLYGACQSFDCKARVFSPYGYGIIHYCIANYTKIRASEWTIEQISSYIREKQSEIDKRSAL
jgi:hypothetical protein